MTIAELPLNNIEAAAQRIPPDTPVIMLNLVRYHAEARYENNTTFAPCSGQEAYVQRYAPAFNAIAAAEGVAGIQVQFLGAVMASLVALPEEQWDAVVLVQYPSFAAFRRVVESPKYPIEAAPHRKAALADWRLIATSPVNLS